MNEAEKKKPFATTKPRSQWKKPKRSERVHGRVIGEICIGQRAGENIYKLFVFEMRSNGLKVRMKHSRNAKFWPLSSLANGVNPTGQMAFS